MMFITEPTSGLDAQSSYNIIKFIRKLADAGMPLVCTIHQPSSALFEFFDRLLLVARGGKVVYFGDLGDKASTLLNYFDRNGARTCSETENPAEYILEVNQPLSFTFAASINLELGYWCRSGRKNRQGLDFHMARVSWICIHAPRIKCSSWKSHLRRWWRCQGVCHFLGISNIPTHVET